MKTHKNQFWAAIFITFVLLICTNIALCDNYITYRLLPGSTFTPGSWSGPTGPTEDLAGTFTWHQTGEYLGDNPGKFKEFDVTDLYFQSQSFTFNLNTTNNHLASTVWYDSTQTGFGEIVDVTGLEIATGSLEEFAWGTYTGPTASPTSLSYSDLWLSGGWLGMYGRMTLYAQQVPEPASALMIGTGLLFVRLKKRNN